MTSAATEKSVESHNSRYVRLHLRFGWWSLLCFLSLGIVLEGMHGLKVGWYLDVSNETRRLMWTLAHAHGTLLSLVHLAFALTVRSIAAGETPWQRVASSSLRGASVALPGGFFLGGIKIYDGDPGLGVLLVPVGAVMLFVAVLSTARAAALVPPMKEQGKGLKRTRKSPKGN